MYTNIKTTDILVVGGALSGLMAALAAHEHSQNVLIVSKAKAGHCGNTLISAGMMAAAIGPDDSPEQFYDNLLASGKGIIDTKLAHKLAFNSKKIFEILVKYGVKFVKNQDQIKLNAAPGHDTSRSVQVELEGIPVQNAGLGFMRPLLTACQSRNIPIIEGYSLVELIKRDDKIIGALFQNLQGNWLQVNAKAVIIATGGYSKLFGITNNTADITADGIAAAFSAGAKLQDMEQAQFFPCMMFKPLKLIPNNILFGLGSKLKNNKNEYFMATYDHAADMATRDVMARSIYYEVQAGRGVADNSVYFDCTAIDSKVWQNEFKALYTVFKNKGVDLTKDCFPVKPCSHYSLGGIMTDDQCRSSLKGLYVAGEAIASVHGANRLAGAGLLEAALFGYEAGKTAACDCACMPVTKEETVVTRRITKPEPHLMQELSQLMWTYCSLIRDAAGLNKALEQLQAIYQQTQSYALREKINLCQAIVQSALLRCESRGAHYRTDYPNSDPEQARHIVAELLQGKVRVAFK